MSAQLTEPLSGSSTSTATSWRVPFLAFLTVFLDGFDTTAIGFVVPTLAREWGVPAAAFTGSFVATSLGAVIGYMMSGRLSAMVGRHKLLMASVALFAIGSCVTALAHSLMSLAALRFITSIGLGAALPAAVSLAVAGVSARRREAMTIAVVSGLSFGATIGGILAGRLIGQFGWPSLFIVGGVLPLLLLPALWFGMPRRDATPWPAARGGSQSSEPGRVASDSHGSSRDTVTASAGSAPAPFANASAERVSSLFAPALRSRTVALWSFAFFVFAALYAMTSWIPSLLVAMGFSPTEAPLGGAALGAGGLVGALLLVPLSAWIGTRRVLLFTTLAAIVLIVCIGKVDLARTPLLLCIAGLGACLIGGTLGQSALAVALYPESSRTSGVGWSAALGRVGSIVGPAVGGGLMAAGMLPRDVVLTACVPIAAAFVALALFVAFSARRAH